MTIYWLSVHLEEIMYFVDRGDRDKALLEKAGKDKPVRSGSLEVWDKGEYLGGLK